MLIGNRIAYTAKFLKNTGQFTGSGGTRRGTFIAYDGDYARVHWDDEAALIAQGRGCYAESDYCEDVRKNGSLVRASNIALVGSARFAVNDLRTQD